MSQPYRLTQKELLIHQVTALRLSRLRKSHLSPIQCARLKPSKLPPKGRYGDNFVHVYECGHIYDGAIRIRAREIKPKTSRRIKGMCRPCWSRITWAGRGVGRGRRKKGSSRPRKKRGDIVEVVEVKSNDIIKAKKNDGKAKVKKPSKPDRRKPLKIWAVRGPMRGNVPARE
ncbi:hypothetical protein F5Y02DRAFT_260228 [Annulohypoxylon stygium]|nr:hypothetical protein F5Y02DRAFT_260228 [Annulohypoxylon stygium]